MFFNTQRKLKPVCEQCGLTPHAPRKRCPDCNLLVCISQCWNKKVGYCNKCASDFLPEQLAKVKGTQSSGGGGKKSAKHPCVSCGKLLKRDDPWGNYGSRMDYCDECHKRRYGY